MSNGQTPAPARAGERAYQALRADIIEWRLPPGSMLAEVEQSRRLGVSRTPLREALARLTAEGLAAPQGGRGIVVTDISLDHIHELFEVREALDCQAAALAAGRRKDGVFEELRIELAGADALLDGGDPSRRRYFDLVSRMDAAIDEAAANQYLLQAQRNLRTHLVRVRRLASDNPERLLAAASEHALIAKAIESRDAPLAIAATRVHLNSSLEHVLSADEPGTIREEPIHG
ncbi:GntR family transcriptional regulator [Arthrobacter monumenti]